MLLIVKLIKEYLKKVIRMKMVVGLGNPGKEYINTRHNVGYLILDKYLGEENWKEKFNGLYILKTIKGEKVLFVKPLTYMNLSGDCVVKFVNYYDIDVKDILVIHDDLDLEVGTYKLKKDSSDGGHNGIKSIINRLSSKSFNRLKVGLSHDRSVDTKDYVLGEFSKTDKDKIDKLQDTFNGIIDTFISEGIEKTMNIYNTKK